MKGIELCADCAFYNLKSRKCTRGCEIEPDSEKGEDVHFFVDCPLPDVQGVKRGKWTDLNNGAIYHYECSCCKGHTGWHEKFCPNCGADMRGTET